MSANPKLPLNEPQQRRLTVTLAGLEKHLAELRERLERGPADLRLTHYQDAISADEAPSLLPAVCQAEAQLRKMADELRLPVQSEPVRRAVEVGLELASINLYECRPESGLAGYGHVAPMTADYLEREIPKLDAAVRSLIVLLQHSPAPMNSGK
ncbi:MAG: hypothetical protein WBN75_05775 [Verrucomicrobiia bacterium]|jgi:hypothetical protein